MTSQNDDFHDTVLYTVASPDGRQPLTFAQIERLHADLHPARVASRTGGGGTTLSYLEAYDVKATLIRIFGYGNFSVEVLEAKVVHQSTYVPDNGNRELWRIAATATVRLTIHQTGAVYTETAAASQSGPDIGEVMDFALKTAESDALKRCAIYLGTTFGLSLYKSGSTRDIVGRVFAPGQVDMVDALREVRQMPDATAQQASLATLQARFKTITPDTPPEDPQDAQEPAQEPQDAPSEPQDTTEAPEPAPQAPVAPRARRRTAVTA